MMKLVPYPEYKDSGQPFLGDIPTHWNLLRNGRLFSQRNETGFRELPILEVSLKTGVRVRDMENLKRKQVMADREKYKRAAQGDIAYNMMRMWQGAVGVAPVDGLVSPAYVVVRPFPEVDCRYFSYLFRTASYMNEVDAYSRGIVKDRNRLYWQDFKRMPSPVPSIEEQRHITRFLDAVGSKAQRFIHNKRRLIELLKEQKQNVINQAVTRGLDPKVTFKPSGVEWIGDIPEHWDITRIGRLLKVNSGDMLSAQDEKTKGYPIYGGNEIRGYTNKWNTEGPIILLGRVGAKCGCVHLVYGKFWASEHALRVRLLRKTNLEFLALLLKTIDLNRLAIRTAQPLINSTIVRSVGVALPPDEEQLAIINHVKEASETIDKAISRAQREIKLMREYRTRLISDVVTGQVDVRGIEVPEVAEDELLALEEDTADADNVIDDEGDMDETN